MITYVHEVGDLTADNLRGFWVGWPNPPSPETHLRLLSHSDYRILALDGATGQELTRRMLDLLQDVYMVDLLCDADLQPFYARAGMRPATGMMVRRMHRQSGM